MANGDPEALEPTIPLEREGQYTRLEELGRGGQSVVVRAFDEFITREVALKELAVSRAGGSSDEVDSDAVTPTVSSEGAAASRRRFLREARLTARLDHPGIVSVLELARRPDGTVFCAQKLIRGETLKQRLARCRSLSERLQLLPNLVAACQAVAYAHSQGVIHRDLKPANIMVGPFGETVVVDWGLAKRKTEPDEAGTLSGSSDEPGLTVAGAEVGTPEYMSPEQARGDLSALDAPSDVFNLGASLYELLTGRPPFLGATPDHVLENASRGKFHPVETLTPDAPPELAAIAHRALRAKPEERYRDSEDLARELSAYLAGGRVRAYEYGAWELLKKFASTHRALLTGAAIAVGALVVAAGVVVARLHQTRIDLASSFLERAYRAEQDGDWSKAAVYFAAARAQHDTREQRWGLATAGERITERILSKRGPADSFVDVGVLPDGRVITVGLARDSNEVEMREAENGKTLWTSSGGPVFEAVVLSQGVVRLGHADGWTFHDAATGRQIQRWPRSRGFPCPGAYPPTIATMNGQILVQVEGAEPRVIATDAVPDPLCAVSTDGRQVVYVTRSYELRLLSVVDGRELARRPPEPARGLQFSRHGLVIFRQGRLEVVGGADGDFTIELPEARFGGFGVQTPTPGGSAVSPDGELVAIASREGATQAAVVDLGARSIRGIVHYAPGWPRFAFSVDGRRLFAAGLDNSSVVSGWQLPADDMPKTPRWWTHGWLSSSGKTALLLNLPSRRFELLRTPKTLIASGVRDLGTGTRIVGDQAIGFITSDESATTLVDGETNRVLWEHPCRVCQDFSVADDGSRFAQVGADGLEVWSARSGQPLLRETRRVRPGVTTVTLSGDGHRVAWTFVDSTVVRDLESGQELSLPLDGASRELRFSPDGRHLLVITTRSLTLWEVTGKRALWKGPKELPDFVRSISWSPDGHAVVVAHGLSATEVLDTGTGERLAWFQALPRAVTPVRAEIYAPDLRLKAVAADKTWDQVPLPQPDETPADQALARTLQKTGLEFRGVELVAAP